MLAVWKERFVHVGAPNFVAGSSMIGYRSLLTARLPTKLSSRARCTLSTDIMQGCLTLI